MSERVRFEITRQDAPDRPDTRRIESFELETTPSMTVSDALFELQRAPVTVDGARVAPIAFESACFSDGCGRCSLLVEGHVRSACRTRVEVVARRGRVRLAPLGKFPLVRDLIVDRSALLRSLVRSHAWLEGVAAMDEATPRSLATFDRCTLCGACLEACPEWHAESSFVGAAALNEVHLLDLLPAGAPEREARLSAVTAEGGVQDCGKAKNCVAVCPEQIPLFDSILALSHDATRRWLGSWLRRGP